MWRRSATKHKVQICVSQAPVHRASKPSTKTSVDPTVKTCAAKHPHYTRIDEFSNLRGPNHFGSKGNRSETWNASWALSCIGLFEDDALNISIFASLTRFQWCRHVISQCAASFLCGKENIYALPVWLSSSYVTQTFSHACRLCVLCESCRIPHLGHGLNSNCQKWTENKHLNTTYKLLVQNDLLTDSQNTVPPNNRWS